MSSLGDDAYWLLLWVALRPYQLAHLQLDPEYYCSQGTVTNRQMTCGVEGEKQGGQYPSQMSCISFGLIFDVFQTTWLKLTPHEKKEVDAGIKRFIYYFHTTFIVMLPKQNNCCFQVVYKRAVSYHIWDTFRTLTQDKQNRVYVHQQKRRKSIKKLELYTAKCNV